MSAATIVDVTLRDGLQDEQRIVPTHLKVGAASSLQEAGLVHLEVASFVHPKRVPQMADAHDVVQGLPKGIRPAVLVMNQRGLQRTLAAFDAAGAARNAYDLVFVVSASPRHSIENSGQPIEAALETFEAVAVSASEAGCAVVGSISCAFASPWAEEEISASAVAYIATRFRNRGCRAVTLCDTVGRARPDDIDRTVRASAALFGTPPALHLHDLAGSAVVNVKAGIAAGVRRFEATLGGLGGCPFAPGSPGNLDIAVLHRVLAEAGIAPDIKWIEIDRAAAILVEALMPSPAA